MDPITHGITGALLGKAFFAEEPDARAGKSRIPSRVAITAATLGALFPDIDSLYGVFDETGLAVISTHRAETHSFVCLPLFALALAGLVVLFTRPFKLSRPSFPQLSAIFGAGIASHIVLDLITSFGTMLFAPLDYTRYQWDLAFILDFTMTGIVLLPQTAAWVYSDLRRAGRRGLELWGLLTLAAFSLRRLALANQVDFSIWAVVVASGVLLALYALPAAGGWGFHVKRRTWCRAGVALLAAYLAACAFANGAAVRRAEEFAAQHNLQVEHLGAMPMPPWLFRWTGLIRTPEGVYAAPINLRDHAAPEFALFADAPANVFTQAARELPAVKTFFAFARFPRTRYLEENGLHIVEFNDLRFFGRRADRPAPFTYHVTFDSSGRVLRHGWVDD